MDLNRDLNPYAPPSLPDQGRAPEGELVPRFKKSHTNSSGLRILFLFVLVPCVFAAALELMGVSTWRMFAVAPLLGLMLLGIEHLFRHATTDSKYRRLQAELRERLSLTNLPPEKWNGEFVQFAPHGDFRQYDNFTEFDVGHLFLLPGRLTFIGDLIKFSLPHETLVQAKMVCQTESIPATYQILVSWNNPLTNEECYLRFWPGLIAREQENTRRLFDRMSDWMQIHRPQTDNFPEYPLPMPITAGATLSIFAQLRILFTFSLVTAAGGAVAIAAMVPTANWFAVFSFLTIAIGSGPALSSLLPAVRTRQVNDVEPARTSGRSQSPGA